MKRQESATTVVRNESILKQIENIKADHPFWGYRRVWAYLKYVARLEVNKKRVLQTDAET